MIGGTTCIGVNPATISRGESAVPNPIPAEASMNSKNNPTKTTKGIMCH